MGQYAGCGKGRAKEANQEIQRQNLSVTSMHVNLLAFAPEEINTGVVNKELGCHPAVGDPMVVLCDRVVSTVFHSQVQRDGSSRMQREDCS